ncbi:glucan biosynthesis protein C [Sphingobium sp. B11D3B]|uniref:acyltransferase family protein n=1 Tax=Sphingobium sp. B11D3B TaxID=2940575 RepID=UPI002225C78A|nr:acyltransferase family protein [Sphingobium sp. B11D3B]MCW2387654.1 glucan biosynthesis protein C [Sphingobium sp. B11D3B]
MRTDVSGREHHWDAMRALLMLLGIPYHVAMAYRANDVWIVNAGEGDLVFTWIAGIIHLFRMPAFFVIAGYFAALLLMRRAPGAWIKNRLIRLGLPFIAALLTLNPLLNLFTELSNFSLWGALGSLEKNSLQSGGYWVRHLWFIIVLLYLCGAAALLCHLATRAGQAVLPARLDDWLGRHMAAAVIGLGVVIGLWQAGMIELFYAWGFATNLPQQILRIDQLVQFAPWFALGWLVCRAPEFRAALHKPSALLALTALAATLLYLQIGRDVHPMTERFIGAIAAISMTQSLIAAMKRLADRPSPTVQALVSGAFVIYLVHLPITAGLVVLGQHIAMPVVVKAGVITALTMALSWGCWRIVQASPTLRLLYDGVGPELPRLPPPPARKTATATAP